MGNVWIFRQWEADQWRKMGCGVCGAVWVLLKVARDAHVIFRFGQM